MSTYPKGKNLSSWAGLILCLLIGFVFVCIGTGIEPVEREEMEAVSIRFQEYKIIGTETEWILLIDDAKGSYEVHHTCSDFKLRQKLGELPAGTELELLLHPQEEYVLGIYREDTPLLDWKTAQQEIRDEDLVFFWMGIGLWALGVVMFAAEKFSKKKK